MPGLVCHLRARRAAAGLSQGALAARAGVSRQAVVAIEAGRQQPSTAVALAFARALDCRVEDLFALPGPQPISARTDAPDPGARVVLGRVDGAWAAHAVADPGRPADGVVQGPAEGGAVSVEPLAPLAAIEAQALVAGCAPLLGILSGRSAARAAWIPANSGRALSLLEAGLVHVAGLHLVTTDAQGGHAPLVRARFAETPMTLVHLLRWRQGLAVAPGNPLDIRDWQDILRDDVRFARREAGSGAHARTVTGLAGAAVPEGGPEAAGHAEVAGLVRWGVADAGVTIEAAARAAGLDFVPLVEERFELVVPTARLEEVSVRRFLEALDAPAFRREVARLPGYDVDGAGQAAEVGP